MADCRLYTFVDTAYLEGRDPSEIARQLGDGGSDLVQFRAKDWPRERILPVAEALAQTLDRAGVRLVVNDHLDVAVAVGASCVHLGQEDFFDAGHTHVASLPGRPARLEVGLSTHSPDQCRRAVDAGADYVAIGPVFATGTKPTARPVTLEYVRWAAASVAVPWFAIGGINETTLPQVLEAGARRVCIVSAILRSPDIAAACRRVRRILDGA
jgi:thiamine-phosphate pyrophosphorylase